MFQLQQIDPAFYRKQTRNATLRVMALFLVIGMITAMTTVEYLKPYNSSLIFLNLFGAAIGLVITGLVVNVFFKNKPWMAEAIYGWRLKRNLLHITNVIDTLKAKADQNDIEALKILRFYHLGLSQMHQLDNNSHELINLKAEKEQLVQKLINLNIDIDQTQFDPEQIAPYKSQAK